MAGEKKKALISKECVACGSCVKVCPVKAISIQKGIRAVVEEQKCVGCGKCARHCPAAVIIMSLKGGSQDAKKAVV